MGIEFHSMDMEQLENMLYEVAEDNTEDMNSFMDLLLDMYGGIDLMEFARFHDFIHHDLGIHSDAELAKMSEEQKRRIIDFVNS